MYHAIIYSRDKLPIQPQPPSIPASAENYGQIARGTHNSTWRSSLRTVIKTKRMWEVITPNPAVPPNRPATADDVGVHVTSQDGSIWTGKQITSGSTNRWVALGTYSSTPGIAIENAPCQVVGAIEAGPFGMDDGTGNIRYPLYRCEAGQPAISYTWEFVAIRKPCRECPPTNTTLDLVGTECACSDIVYKLKEVEYSEFEYYWQLISDESILTVKPSGIVKLENFDITLRAYEDDNGSITGAIDQDLDDPFMFEIRDDKENQIYAGFIKNWKFDNGIVKFNIGDFRTVLNTDIILDYSDGDSDFRLFKIFEKVTNQVKINSRQLLYEFNFPQDEIDTKHIASYEGQYIIVNAQAFLKVYLSYYNYVIDKRYDYARNMLVFTFRKQASTLEEIRLDDFEHEKTLNDIKTNRVVATIKFQTIYEADTEWTAVDKIAWDTAASENKSTLMAEELPPLEGYSKDHVIRLAKGVHFKAITAAQYNALEVKHEVRIPLTSGTTILGEVVEHPDTKDYPPDKIIPVIINYPGQPINYPPAAGQACSTTNEFMYVYYYIDPSTGWYEIYGIYTCEGYTQYSCPITEPTLEQIEEKFNVKDYELEAGLKVSWQDSNGQDCGLYTYVQVWSDQVEYYKKGGVRIIPRPDTIATKVYSLGADNNIYEGNAPERLTLYPVQTKIFENETLAKAQIDAVYHLVANRWNENIILTDQKRPLDLSKLQLINLVRVYDKNGAFKDLPISERMMTFSKGHLTRKIKLGFKKELFTQIYKSDSTQGVLK